MRRPTPSPRRGRRPAAFSAQWGPGTRGTLGREAMVPAPNCFDLLWPFGLIARHDLFRTSQNERPGVAIQPSRASPVGFILLIPHRVWPNTEESTESYPGNTIGLYVTPTEGG